jgi:hypothetical protein
MQKGAMRERRGGVRERRGGLRERRGGVRRRWPKRELLRRDAAAAD